MTEVEEIQYSERYTDDIFEYRHVIVPANIAKLVPKTHLMTETEWRNLGIQQSPGWVHYIIHAPESHVICFRRKLQRSSGVEDLTTSSSSDFSTDDDDSNLDVPFPLKKTTSNSNV